MKANLQTSGAELIQLALDAASAEPMEDRKPITNAEAAAVLKRFRLIDLLNLVIASASHTSNAMSMTVESHAEPKDPKDRAVKVVVRVTHPRAKKGES